MKFVVDAQVFQTNTWYRGMGKYSLELLKALEARGYFKKNPLTLVLNSALPMDADRRSLLEAALPTATFITLDLHTTNALNLKEAQAYNRGELNHAFNGDNIFLIPSLFENEITPAFPDKAYKILIGYDLIPLLFYDRYLSHSEPVRNNYFGRFNTLFQAHHIFTISQTTANDYSRLLGLPLNGITNIDGARITLSATDKKPKYIPKRKFLLSTSGDDLRKNNERMVKAFAEYSKRSGANIELLITSDFGTVTQQKLNKLSANIKFTGNVDEGELNWYYKNAEALLFVPEYEGLGLPVLEAVESGQKVICSDAAVFREMVTDQSTFNFCDPYDVDSISNAIEAAMNRKDIPYLKYGTIKKKYDWARTADLFIDHWNSLQKSPISNNVKKKKIAVIGPHPGGKSAIGKVIETAHFELSKVAEPHYFFETPKDDAVNLKHSFIEYVSDTKSIRDFNSKVASLYDIVIYHLGSSSYHLKSIIEALAVPGTAILHDTRLEGAYGCLLASKMIDQQRLNAETLLDRLLGVQDVADHIVSLVNVANKIVVHSNFARTSVKRCEVNNKPVIYAGLPIGLSAENYRFDRQRLTIAIAGIISKTKGLNLLIDLLESQKFNNSTFSLFGYDFAVDSGLLNELAKYKNLTILKNLSDLEFHQQLKEADILLNYRDYYHGETSYATLEAMREGVVPVVRDVGWFSELPSEAVQKVSAKSEVENVLSELVRDKNKLKRMSKLCYQYIVEQHSPANYINDLIAETK